MPIMSYKKHRMINARRGNKSRANSRNIPGGKAAADKIRGTGARKTSDPFLDKLHDIRSAVGRGIDPMNTARDTAVVIHAYELPESFPKGVKAEAKRVTWPGKSELWESTLVVISFIFILAATTLVCDKVIEFFVGLVTK